MSSRSAAVPPVPPWPSIMVISCVPATRTPIESAICATRITRLPRDSDGVVCVAPRDTESAWSGARAVTRNAGSRPEATAHPTAVASVQTNTTASIGIGSDKRASSAVSTMQANGSATIVAAAARTRLSISRWRTTRPRLAPIARRMATSRRWWDERASVRLAAFAHARASTSTGIAMTINKASLRNAGSSIDTAVTVAEPGWDATSAARREAITFAAAAIP